MKRALTVPLLVAILGLLAPAAASATTQTATGGAVTATLTFSGVAPKPTNLNLTITQAGAPTYDEPVTVSGCTPYCVPGAVKGASVLVEDLAGNGQEDVILDLYSGGAHCCFFDQIFSPSATPGGYTVTTEDFENSGAALRDLNDNGQTEFVTADNAFAYEFTDYAESGMPIEILSFSGGVFHNVTRSYPKLIRADANLWWHAYLSDYRSSGRVGLIAAWAADEDNLGLAKTASKTLAREVKRRHITARFVKQLDRFLKRYGYTH